MLNLTLFYDVNGECPTLGNNNSNRESQITCICVLKPKYNKRNFSTFLCKMKYNLIKKNTTCIFLLVEFFGKCYHNNNNKKREIVEMICHDLHVIIFCCCCCCCEEGSSST